MPVTTLGGRQIHVNDEGFLTDPPNGMTIWATRWPQYRITLTDPALEGHPLSPRRLRGQRGRPRPSDGSRAAGGIPVKELFKLFPRKPAKKMAYIAGLPKPHGCV